MSYILDAINKSDRERQLRQGPSLIEAYQSERYHSNQPGFWRTLAVLLLLILVCGAIFGVYLAGLMRQEPVSLRKEVAEVSDGEAAPGIVPPFHAVAERWQLPDELRRELPALEFTLHVYSELPQQRSIIINNRMMREGEAFDRDLSLQAITEEGVIMLFHSEYFGVRVVENWQE